MKKRCNTCDYSSDNDGIPPVPICENDDFNDNFDGIIGTKFGIDVDCPYWKERNPIPYYKRCI